MPRNLDLIAPTSQCEYNVFMSDLSSFYPSQDNYLYTFHIGRSPAFIYVNNPKCGCSTTKASLNRWYAAWHSEVLGHKSLADIHNRAFNPLFDPTSLGTEAEDILLHNPTYFRFTLLRDPLSRVASAFENKMTWLSEERVQFNLLLGRNAEDEVAFDFFLETLATIPEALDINEHWRLQTRQIAASLLNYNHICLFDNLTNELLAIRDRLFPGLQIGVFETRTHFPEIRSNSAARLASLLPHQRALIEIIYEADFNLYNTLKTARCLTSEAEKHNFLYKQNRDTY